MAARLYRELLPRVPELLVDVDRLEPLRAAEDAHLRASDAAIGDGRVTITEQPELDSCPDAWHFDGAGEIPRPA